MNEQKQLRIFWGILAVLLAGGMLLSTKVGGLSALNPSLETVMKLLATFFVLALFVERTLEVFITAWRGTETVKREKELQAAETRLAANTADLALQNDVKNKTGSLAEYKSETKAIALRAGLVLGILISAVGVRSFGTFVSVGSNFTQVQPFWLSWLQGSFNVLDVIISGGIIGGGSDAVHKLMTVVTQFFEMTAKNMTKP